MKKVTKNDIKRVISLRMGKRGDTTNDDLANDIYNLINEKTEIDYKNEFIENIGKLFNEFCENTKRSEWWDGAKKKKVQ